ncbi:MAG: CaiB/BaiF CoA-transferase family protein [Desulfobacterales bacterium]|nr:CaiB/BaiF CoA-transferase family protein [Desulfobacterales bacterium]
MSPQGALSGITVLDLSRLLPGPYCSMVLADHGARVIAIEDKRFAAEALGSAAVYRNKTHMTLNLKSEQGRRIFFHMAQSADVVLEGFRPGVTKRLGVDYEAVSAVNPKIIYCSITGYGQTGPYAGIVGHDVNYLSAAGVLDLIGEKDRPPSIPGIQIADIAGGGMNGVIGILLALYARNTTGKGQYIDISMTDGSLSLLSLAVHLKELTGLPLKRSDSLLSHRYACYNTYETADHRYLSIGAVENRFWQQLCDFFKVPEYGPLQYDEKRREEIKGYMRDQFKSKTLAEWERALDGLEICWAPVRTPDEALASDLFAARDMVTDLLYPDGKTRRALGVPVKMSHTPGAIQSPPPGFGQDTAAVLKEFGYSDTEIDEFYQQDVL